MKRAAEAIIAALSVQSSIGDQLQLAPRAPRTARRRGSRSSALAATPPPSATRLPLPALQRALELRRRAGSTIAALVGGGEVGARFARPLLAELAHLVDERGLQAAEGEVEARVARHRDRETRTRPGRPPRPRAGSPGRPDSRGRAGARPCRRPRPPRRRACRRAPRTIAARAPPASSVWPPLAIRQRNGGSSGLGLEEVGGDVAVQVVDRDQRQALGGGQRLGGADARRAGRRSGPGPA